MRLRYIESKIILSLKTVLFHFELVHRDFGAARLINKTVIESAEHCLEVLGMQLAVGHMIWLNRMETHMSIFR